MTRRQILTRAATPSSPPPGCWWSRGEILTRHDVIPIRNYDGYIIVGKRRDPRAPRHPEAHLSEREEVRERPVVARVVFANMPQQEIYVHDLEAESISVRTAVLRELGKPSGRWSAQPVGCLEVLRSNDG